MEATIATAEERVQTLDATLNDPSFYITRSQEASKFSDDLEAAKAEVARLYLRWDELEAIRAAMNV
jgi:ATP-binding cassette subfamily F protein uup